MTRTPPYQLIIFDWDGTLMDSEARIVNCLRKAAMDAGMDDQTDDFFSNVIGLGLREAIQQLFPRASQTEVENMTDTYRHHYLHHDQTPSALFAGTTRILDQLEQSGYLLAIATGKGREGLDQSLKASGLKGRFPITRCASETRSKPHPQMLEEILDFTGLYPADALMIGDTEYDMLMAANIGMDRLGVSYGVHPVERLQQHQPIGVLHQITELPGFLHQQTPSITGTDND